MPVYTYQCEVCGQRFDAKQKFSDPAISVCPECGGPTHKVIGPVGVIFKGSGFYVNDSKGKNPANAKANARSDSGDSNDSNADSGASSDSKNAPAEPANNAAQSDSSSG